MIWNWQRTDWPQFSYDKASLENLETQFLHKSGILIGAYKHVKVEDQNNLLIDIMSNEAFKTSQIEGEILNRESLQSSLRRNFGLNTDRKKIPPAEQGGFPHKK